MTSHLRAGRRRAPVFLVFIAAVLALVAAACVPTAPGGTTTTTEPTIPTTEPTIPPTTEPPVETVDVSGVELTWGYSRYSQYGVFGPWRQWTNGDDVELSLAEGQSVSGNAEDAGVPFRRGHFQGGTGQIDPATGAGTITWDTGDWVINAYPPDLGAPDETYSDPILTIDASGTGTLSMVVYLPAHWDYIHNSGTVPAVGPARQILATFDSVDALSSTGFTVTPDFEGRPFVALPDYSQWQACDGIGGSWPSEFINFLEPSVQAHYYTTSCGGLNLMKGPLPFTVSWAASAPTITTQPVVAASSMLAGSDLGLSVYTAGAPSPSLQWQRSFDNGSTWNDIAGATLPTYPFKAQPDDNGAMFRVVATNSSGTVQSDPTGAVAVSYVAAAITQQPNDSNVGRGGDASFLIKVTGSPAPTITWLRSNDQGATWGPAAGTLYFEGTTIFISPAVDADNGALIKAQVSNGFGPVLETEVRKINVLPVISSQPVSDTTWDGTLVSFTTTVSPTVPPVLRWQSSADNGATWTDWVVNSTVASQTGANRVLQIPSPTLAMNGWKFRLRATTDIDVSYSDEVTLTVLAPSGVPQLHAISSLILDPTVANNLRFQVAGFTPTTASVAVIIDAALWQPGQTPPTSGWVGTRAISVTSLGALGRYRGAVLASANTLDPTKTYGIATWSTVAGNRSFDTWTPITVTQPAG